MGTPAMSTNIPRLLESHLGEENMNAIASPISKVLTDMKTYAKEKPQFAIISALALAALGFLVTSTVRFMLPIPVIMPLIANTANVVIGAATLFMLEQASKNLA